MSDIFDRLTELNVIEPDEEDLENPLDLVEEDNEVQKIKSALLDLQKQLSAKEKKRKDHNRKLTDDLKTFIQTEVSKIKVPQKTVIEKIEPRYLEPKIVQAPPQIIRETRVEVEKKDQTKYAPESVIKELRSQIEDLKKNLEDAPKNPALNFNGMGFRTGKIIPSLAGNNGKYLKANGSKLEWATVQASGGGSSSDEYTVSNVTTNRSLNANDTSLDEIADVLGSLIESLQGAGIIQ